MWFRSAPKLPSSLTPATKLPSNWVFNIFCWTNKQVCSVFLTSAECFQLSLRQYFLAQEEHTLSLSWKTSAGAILYSLLSFHIRPQEMCNTCPTFHSWTGVHSRENSSVTRFLFERVLIHSFRWSYSSRPVICPAFQMHLYSAKVAEQGLGGFMYL